MDEDSVSAEVGQFPAGESDGIEAVAGPPTVAERRSSLLRLDQIHRAAAAETLTRPVGPGTGSILSVSFIDPVVPGDLADLLANEIGVSDIRFVKTGFVGVESGTYHQSVLDAGTYDLGDLGRYTKYHREYVDDMIRELESEPEVLAASPGLQELLADMSAAPAEARITGVVLEGDHSIAVRLDSHDNVTVASVPVGCDPLNLVPPLELNEWVDAA